MRANPMQIPKTDCAFYRPTRSASCTALSVVNCKLHGQCPFYITGEALRRKNAASLARLEALGRYDLIAKYHTDKQLMPI